MLPLSVSFASNGNGLLAREVVEARVKIRALMSVNGVLEVSLDAGAVPAISTIKGMNQVRQRSGRSTAFRHDTAVIGSKTLEDNDNFPLSIRIAA